MNVPEPTAANHHPNRTAPGPAREPTEPFLPAGVVIFRGLPRQPRRLEPAEEATMDTNTLLIILLVVLLLGGGGYYGRGRWF
jgi:hypothetical protein